MTSALDRFIETTPGTPTGLPATDRFGRAGHLWSGLELDAITFALASERPLLVRGEAGCGKSQIARAAAAVTGGQLFCEVIHPRFEALDLLYRFDLVGRLADAQVHELDKTNERYIRKGALWEAMAASTPEAPLSVLLIDEIDKADADVPNALLDVLGNRTFRVPQLNDRVVAPRGPMPLVVITTNEERELPAAFVRRCGVLNLSPPEGPQEFVKWLCDRSRVHEHLAIDDDARELAAKQVLEDRKASVVAGYPPVGLAEYIDLLHSLHSLTAKLDAKGRRMEQLRWLDRLSRFALVKSPRQSQARAALGEAARSEGPRKA